jgi:hypothetical protein
VDIRQLAKVPVMSWRKYCGLSPIGESPGGVLAKVMWTFSIGEGHVDFLHWRKSYWRNMAEPKKIEKK